MSRIVVMGSGETAPTMVKVHREVLAGTVAGPAVMLDTPFAFQMNRDELVTRTQTYFAQSVGRDVEVAAWSGSEDAAQQEKSLALLDRAAWAFAGPGSPTYALRHWRGTPVPAALAGVVRRGGTVVLGSAAAVTLGSHAVPVYEIYKVGAEPEWAEGLDLLGELTGIAAAVIPHYDSPVLLVWGDSCEFFPPGDAERLASDFPHATLQHVPGAKTWVPVDDPAALSDAIAGFVPRLTPASRRA